MNNLWIKNKQQGMTLIEILIALVLGSFLLAGVYKIFLNSKQNYLMQEGLSRMQESGRFALEFISRDIRMSGYEGCSTTTATPVNNMDINNPNPNPVPITLPVGSSISLTGNDNVANNWNTLACGGANSCTAGTDVISYHFGRECARLTGSMGTNNANIQITAANTCNFQAYDVVLISDCAASDVFTATNVSNGGGVQTIAHAANQNTSVNLSKIYDADAIIYKMDSATFFLRTGAGGQSALWKMDNTKATGGTNPVELIEGVEDMQILYGEDTDADGTANYYVSAGSVISMIDVVSVRIALTVKSMSNRLSTTAADGRLDQTYSTTISLRNRL